MTEGEINFMLAHLYRHDLIKVEYEYESPFEPFRGIGGEP
jgi:hypothetical protein